MNQALLLIALAAANSGISMRIIEPMLPLLAQEFDASIPATAAIITSFGIAQASAQYFHGPLGDRYGKLRVATILLSVGAFMSFGCATAHSLNAMIFWRFGMAFFTSGIMVIGMAYLADIVAPEDRQPLLARFVSGTIIGQALGPLCGGAIADLVGWRANFVLLGLVFAAIAAAMFIITRREWTPVSAATGSVLSPARYLNLLRGSRVRAVLMSVTTEMLLFYGAFSFLGVLLKQKFDLSFTLIGMLLTGFGIGGLLYIAVVRVLLERLGQRGCVLWGGIGSATFYTATVLMPVWPPVMLCTIGIGFSFYLMHNTLQMKATEMAPQMRATGISLFSIGWASGQAVGAAAMGALVTVFGYAPMIISFGLGLALLGATLRAQLHRL